MRQIVYYAAYCRCSGPMETTLHAIRDYPIAARVWKKLLPFQLHSPFFDLDVQEWISHNLK